MKIDSETRNQHYLPQVEQRLNSFNPCAKKENQRIYSFNIVNREGYKITLLSDNGCLIENNLSLDDLFSFDVVDRKIRANFEVLFQAYECNVEIYTRSLLKKLQIGNCDVKEELLNLFSIKFLNFFRNPHGIENAIDTIGVLADYYPLDPVLARIYSRIENGRKPQQTHLCAQLGITNEIYHKWLKTLFMLLMRPKLDEPNMLEQVIKSLYENESHHINIFIFNYTGEHIDKRPLLSDRGFNSLSQNEGCLVFTFNLCANAFICYSFADLDKQNFVEVPEWRIELFKKTTRKNLPVTYVENNLEALASYNKNTIYQAKEKVYCSSKFVYGL